MRTLLRIIGLLLGGVAVSVPIRAILFSWAPPGFSVAAMVLLGLLAFGILAVAEGTKGGAS